MRAEDLWPFVVEPIGPIVIIILVGLVALRAVRLLVRGLVTALFDREATEGTPQELSAIELQKRADTLATLGTRLLQAFVVVVVGLMVLDKLDVNVGPAIAGLGVVGIAVGFGAQSLVKDYFNGALILVENQFSIGDVVTIADVTGAVEDLTLRRTTLRDLDGVVHTIPNSEIKVSANRTRTWARINQDVTIEHGSDVDRAISVVDAVGRAMEEDPIWKRRLLEPPRVERIEAIGEYGVTLKILGSVRAVDQWAAGGELRKRLLAAFNEHGIAIPRPQRVVLARDPDGAGPRPPEVTVEPPGGPDTGAAGAAGGTRA